MCRILKLCLIVFFAALTNSNLRAQLDPEPQPKGAKINKYVAQEFNLMEKFLFPEKKFGFPSIPDIESYNLGKTFKVKGIGPLMVNGDPVPVTDAAATPDKIVLGKPTPGAPNIGIPWQVALVDDPGRRSNFLDLFCGGTLIDKEWVITAAHCLSNKTKADIKVVTGLVFLDPMKSNSNALIDDLKDVAKTFPKEFRKTNAQRTGVAGFRIHPSADIALVKIASVENALNTKWIPILTLEEDNARLSDDQLSKQPNTTTLLASGWGATTFGGAAFNQLHFGTITPKSVTGACEAQIKNTCRPPIKDSEVAHCKRMMTDNAVTRRNIICALITNLTPADACQGDSGGPAIIDPNTNPRLAGVISNGIGCSKVNTFSIYTRVSTFTDWIEVKKKEIDADIAAENKKQPLGKIK